MINGFFHLHTIFSDHYRYTWILTSMVFGVATMMGVFAGRIIKEGNNKLLNSELLLATGLVLLMSGWFLSFQTPIIKQIWTTSMTLSIANSLLWGLERYVGDYYGAILTFANFMILFLILNLMYRLRIFVKI